MLPKYYRYYSIVVKSLTKSFPSFKSAQAPQFKALRLSQKAVWTGQASGYRLARKRLQMFWGQMKWAWRKLCFYSKRCHTVRRNDLSAAVWFKFRQGSSRFQCTSASACPRPAPERNPTCLMDWIRQSLCGFSHDIFDVGSMWSAQASCLQTTDPRAGSIPRLNQTSQGKGNRWNMMGIWWNMLKYMCYYLLMCWCVFAYSQLLKDVWTNSNKLGFQPLQERVPRDARSTSCLWTFPARGFATIVGLPDQQTEMDDLIMMGSRWLKLGYHTIAAKRQVEALAGAEGPKTRHWTTTGVLWVRPRKPAEAALRLSCSWEI